MKYLAILTLALTLNSPLALAAGDYGGPYKCDNGYRVTFQEETGNALIESGDRSWMLPGRFSHSTTAYWQVEGQEDECTHACLEITYRGDPVAYVTIEGKATVCYPEK